MVWLAGTDGVLVEVEVDVEPESSPVSVPAPPVDAAVLCEAVLVADEEDESLPLSSPPRRTTKTIRRTASPPRTIPARWTPDRPRPGSSPPVGGGFSGVLMTG